MFSIALTDIRRPAGRGEIRLGDFREEFEVVFEYWSPEDYERQWFEALNILLEEGKPSALITSLTDPDNANFLFWWPAYYEGDHIVFQNSVLLLDELASPFVLSRYAEFVPPRERMTEDGEPISEWKIPIEDIREFLARSGWS